MFRIIDYAYYRLTEDIIWFEPPVVCRWESVEESNMSEKNEPKEEAKLDNPCTTAISENRVVIEDFNLLDVPAGLDLFTILGNFVVPRMPDGYIVKMGDREVKSRKTSTGIYAPLYCVQLVYMFVPYRYAKTTNN